MFWHKSLFFIFKADEYDEISPMKNYMQIHAYKEGRS